MAPNDKTILSVPVVTKSFVEKMLGQKIAKYNTASGSKPGDNVMGTLLCLNVTLLDGNTLELVVKSVLPLSGPVTPETLVYSWMIADSRPFIKEIVYFERIRPIFAEVWREKQDSDRIAFFTHPVVHAQLHDKGSKGLFDYIAMDDLRPQGYKMVDKTVGLTLEETRATLKGLALMHATSYALLNGNGRLSKNFDEIVKDPESIVWENGLDKDYVAGADNEKLFNETVARMIDIIGEMKPEFTTKLRKFADDGFNKVIGLWKGSTQNGKYFRVLLHGDLWTNNILYKYGRNGALEDVKFIDYQYNHLGNIYEELQGFIYTSTTAEFRRSNLAACWQGYYKEFAEVLKLLQCPMPEGFSEDQFHASLKETMEFGFIIDLFAKPWQLGIPPEAEEDSVQEVVKEVDFNQEVDHQNTFDKMVDDLETATRNSPIAKQRLLELIDEMVYEGFCDE